MVQRRISSHQAISNRDRKRRPKKGNMYCHSCDGWEISDGVRCPCGYMFGKKGRRNKK